MAILPTTTYEQKICRQLAQMIMYCTLIDPDQSFFVMSDSMELKFEATTHGSARNKIWKLAGELVSAVNDMAKSDNPNSYPIFGPDSLNKMIEAKITTCNDSFPLFKILELKGKIIYGAKVYGRMQNLTDDSEFGKTFAADHELLWVLLEGCLTTLYGRSFSLPEVLEDIARSESRVRTALYPPLVAKALNVELLTTILCPFPLIEFSLEEDKLLGNSSVLALLSWTMALVPFSFVFFDELRSNRQALKNVTVLYENVKTELIEAESGLLMGWLAGLEHRMG